MISPTIPEDEKQRLEKLRALKILDSAPEERFDRLTRMAKRMFGVDISVLSLIDDGRQWFKSKASENELPDETPREISFCGHAILGNDVFVVEDTFEDHRFKDNPLVTENPHIRFYAGYPLTIGNGSALGTLCIIDDKPREFDPEDLQLLRDLGAMAEQEIAALQLATLDDLTLISNRRGFTELAKHSLNVCRRKGLSASILLFDLNKFKPINDQFGHAEGDRALIVFANTLRKVFRDSDVFGRLGGDEFAVLMMDVDAENTQQVIQRFNDEVTDYNKEAARGYDIEYSVGFVNILIENHIDVNDLLDAADKKMYAEKSNNVR
ncbi:MAG: sensor domain-containing diguanylate cyclase [Methylophaga sp.]|uniref:sensor domain-containing diguanylate cyclase n=1 Tax=Methylophaga sp. TaxID=2024840 RepID=UPI00299D65B2|nr:sensor domain-containing diguanylate cyclase [Methylophaga sp.]MDX1751310.1 sensor domain-containing diguanylate cyclase [Methylophaga sp.]